jgi:kynureninase
LRSRLRPALTGWLAHRQPFAFTAGAIDPRHDSYRFLNGTPHIPALYACQPGLSILNAIGSRAIREKSLRMTGGLLEDARRRGWRVNTPQDPSERAGTVSVDCPHALEVSRELLARNILIDYRPQAGIRISPHFYNRDEECQLVVSEIDDILNAGAWAKHALAAEQA